LVTPSSFYSSPPRLIWTSASAFSA
jgi:hypothetical protein